MICCNEIMNVVDFKHGQYKCECEVCGSIIYHQPFNGD